MKSVFFLIILSSLAWGYEIRLLPPDELYQFEDHLTVDLLASEQLINEEFKEYLQYGIVIHFTYFINFYQEKIFFDNLLETRKISVSLKFDLWTKKYSITRYSPKMEINFDSIDEVIAELTKLEKVKVVPLSKLKENKNYYFKTRITAKITQFESYFYIIFSLLSIIKYKTTYLISDSFSGSELLSLPHALEK